MATVIFCDGLAGDGKLKFWDISNTLEVHGHTIRFANIRNVRTHDDRVQAVRNEVESVRSGEKIILVGFSAGGSACHIAASGNNRWHVSAEVLISPAMPRGIPVFTRQLLRCMMRHLIPLLLSRGGLEITSDELISLSGPLDMRISLPMIRARRPVSLPEARELAFIPPKFIAPMHPVLYCYGTSDRWVSPRAHRKYVARLHASAPIMAPVYARPFASGHDILSSRFGNDASEEIARWIRCFVS